MNAAIVLLQEALPLLNGIVRLIEVATSADADKLTREEVEAEVAKIKQWADSASKADWYIVKGGK